jgi:hypothetical protein
VERLPTSTTFATHSASPAALASSSADPSRSARSTQIGDLLRLDVDQYGKFA